MHAHNRTCIQLFESCAQQHVLKRQTLRTSNSIQIGSRSPPRCKLNCSIHCDCMRRDVAMHICISSRREARAYACMMWRAAAGEGAQWRLDALLVLLVTRSWCLAG
jgi:hypothetical protein